MPTLEEMKETVLKFTEEVFNKGDMAYADRTLADDMIEHGAMPGMGTDKKAALMTMEAIKQMSSDLKAEVVDMVASGDKVAIRTVMRGTDTGGAMPGAPATNKPFEIESIDVVRVNPDGTFAEHWGIADMMGMMGQLGLLPPPPQS